MPDEFLDTNVLVYAFTTDVRASKAQLLLERGCLINVQILNEFANVARRKLKMSWVELQDALDDIRTLCPTIAAVTLDTHSAGLERAQRYGLSVFDGLVVAAALEAGCATLWSEDMHHGLVIDERLRVLNPFVEGEPGSP
ncbi:MAG TPA: PIN domain-containing protein [Steroidobacteraceae bacterium]|nr:PIN domain-containing protein [Steroidobacteraceae bacterium]